MEVLVVVLIIAVLAAVADEIRKTCNQTEGCSATVDPQTGEVTTTQCDTEKKTKCYYYL